MKKIPDTVVTAKPRPPRKRAAPAKAKPQMDATAKEILAMDAKRYSAMINLDKKALRELLHGDMVYTHSSGAVDTKESYIAAMGKKYRYSKARRTDQKVRIYGNTALLTGRAVLNVAVDGEPKVLKVSFLCVWVKSVYGWRFAAWQSCKLP